MNLETITCNNCGAPLEVPADANFATCRHCGSHLAVKRTESASFTEVVNDLKQQVDKLTRQNEIEALDREWEIDKEKFYVSDNDGKRRLPTKTGSLVGGIVITVFGIFWTVMAAGMTSAFSAFGGSAFGGGFSCFPLFGVAFVIFGIAMSVVSYVKAGEYEQAHRRYRRRRKELLRRRDS